jgi:DNA-binding MarR family transcriptional regulator
MTTAAQREIEHLIPQVCRAHYEQTRSLFRRLGLARGQPGVLRLLWQNDGMTQTELGAALRIQPATVTRMMQRMETAGWVERRPDPDDQRVWRVYQTDAARRIRPDVEGVMNALSEAALRGFSPEEQQLVHGFLTRMRDNLRQA